MGGDDLGSLRFKIEAVTAPAVDAIDQVKKKAGEASTETGGLSSVMLDFGKRCGEVALGMIGANGITQSIEKVIEVSQESVERFADFEHSLALVSTQASLSSGDMQELSTGVSDLAKKYGQDSGGLAKALIDILPHAGSAKDSLTFLSTAIKGTVTGAGDLNQVIGLLDSTTDAFGLTVSDTGLVLDKLKVGAIAGEMPLSKLSEVFAQVAPLAANANVSIDELIAAMAAMGRAGIPAQQAVGSLKILIDQMIDPTSKLNKALGTDGVQAAGDFTKILQLLSEKTAGNAQILNELIPGVRGLQGVMVLAGSGAKDYSDALEKVGNAAGKTESDLAKMEDTTHERLNKMKSAWQEFMTGMGGALVGIAEAAATGINAITNFGDSLIEKANPGMSELISLQEKSNKTIEDWDRIADLAISKSTELYAYHSDYYTQQAKQYEAMAVQADAEIAKLKEKQAQLTEQEKINQANADSEKQRAAEKAAQYAREQEAIAARKSALIEEWKFEGDEYKNKTAGEIQCDLDQVNNFLSTAKYRHDVDKETLGKMVENATATKDKLEGLVQERADKEIEAEKKKQETLLSLQADTQKAIAAAQASGLDEQAGIIQSQVQNVEDAQKKMLEAVKDYVSNVKSLDTDQKNSITANLQALLEATNLNADQKIAMLKDALSKAEGLSDEERDYLIDQFSKEATDYQGLQDQKAELDQAALDAKMAILEQEKEAAFQQLDAMREKKIADANQDPALLAQIEEWYKASSHAIEADWGNKVSKELEVSAKATIEMSDMTWNQFKAQLADFSIFANKNFQQQAGTVAEGVVTRITGTFKSKLQDDQKWIGDALDSVTSFIENGVKNNWGQAILSWIDYMTKIFTVQQDYAQKVADVDKKRLEETNIALGKISIGLQGLKKDTEDWLRSAGLLDVSNMSKAELSKKREDVNTQKMASLQKLGINTDLLTPDMLASLSPSDWKEFEAAAQGTTLDHTKAFLKAHPEFAGFLQTMGATGGDVAAAYGRKMTSADVMQPQVSAIQSMFEGEQNWTTPTGPGANAPQSFINMLPQGSWNWTGPTGNRTVQYNQSYYDTLAKWRQQYGGGLYEAGQGVDTALANYDYQGGVDHTKSMTREDYESDIQTEQQIGQLNPLDAARLLYEASVSSDKWRDGDRFQKRDYYTDAEREIYKKNYDDLAKGSTSGPGEVSALTVGTPALQGSNNFVSPSSAPSINVPQLYGEGGLATSPGIVSEDYQPELVLPLTRPDRVQDLLGAALMPLIGGASGGGTFNISLSIDPNIPMTTDTARTMGQALGDRVAVLIRARGAS